MSRKKKMQDAMDRARRTAVQMKPVADRTRQVAGHQMRRARTWAAPQVERTGQALQEKVAPKVSAMLSSAAERIEPGKPSRRRWAVPLAAVLTAAAGAVASAATVLSRRRQGSAGAWPAETDTMRPSGNGQSAGQDEPAGKASSS